MVFLAPWDEIVPLAIAMAAVYDGSYKRPGRMYVYACIRIKSNQIEPIAATKLWSKKNTSIGFRLRTSVF